MDNIDSTKFFYLKKETSTILLKTIRRTHDVHFLFNKNTRLDDDGDVLLMTKNGHLVKTSIEEHITKHVVCTLLFQTPD